MCFKMKRKIRPNYYTKGYLSYKEKMHMFTKLKQTNIREREA